MVVTERKVKYTRTLLFSIFIAVFGNSFLYGYSIGDVNNPAGVMRVFYVKVLWERAGKIPKNWDGSDISPVVAQNGTASTTTLGPVSNSTNTSMSLLEQMKKYSEEDDFVELLWSITVSIFVLFGMIGSFMSGKLAERLGRRGGMMAITFIMMIAAVIGGIPIAAQSFEVIIVHRALVGLHNGLSLSLNALYLAEISPKKIRGAVGTCQQLFITVGILTSNILGVSKVFGTDTLWPGVFIFNAFPAIVCLIGLPFCPESPRYLLITKGKVEEARTAMKRLTGYSDVEDELDEMKAEASKQKSVKSFTLKQLLVAPELRLPVIIACALQAGQQASGINAVMSYSSFMYKNAGVPAHTVEWVVCGTSLINMLTTIPAVPLMERLGRRPLLIYPMSCMLVSFIVLTIFHNLQYVDHMESHHNIFAIIGIIAMHTYVMGFALGLGPIPFFVVGEIFRQEPRSAAMSISLCFNWVCNFILMLVFRFMQKGLSGYVYLPFCAVLLLTIIFIVLVVPETKNRTFDDVAAELSHGFRLLKRKGGLPEKEENSELKPMTS
ncbi:solute carrier family 2, facilitated glucose transporter member 5-like [Mytilus galloprovincialis]|uniref:solute carrier family 2, facilitated glucose transporter member 5-like n=1 Tax=Mytilus galloprovincialis TaxID=29158 RepID=UPI003F7BDD6A